jgi:hypothetical protein
MPTARPAIVLGGLAARGDHSDDDGQTFSVGRDVDLTLARPRLSRCGSFRRRTHRITHSANNPFRVEAFELAVR